MFTRCFLFALLLAALLPLHARAAERPNILWITAEDMSPTLGCYGDEYAHTPHLDKLASESVLYTHAFATSPVCSPARACLINGVPATTQGTHQMRSAFPIPEKMTGFPSFLRKAGYYTSNNVKTDYNSANWKKIIEASWNESSDDAHWRKRDKDQPFFSVFNLMTSHQSRTMVWPYEQFVKEVQSKLTKDEIHDPAKAPLPPYYPDTPVVRKTVARYYDCVTAMDKEVGAILAQLEADGLADDTIVFFYSDHGSGMPRHKRALLDSGMRVAMMVRFPEKWRHLAPGKPGTKTDRLVSFDDFGPSVLSLAGVDIPDYMTGKPFLGEAAAEPRKYVFGHRDRVDEVLDCARSVRDRRYLYIRNFMPHLGYNQPTAWPDQGEIRHEFYRIAARKDWSGLSEPLKHFISPTRPVEELYDCEADPQNTKNLVGSPEHADALTRMRAVLEEQMIATGDAGFIPEAEMWNRIGEDRTPMAVMAAMNKAERLSLIHAAANVTGLGLPKPKINAMAASNVPAIRYWLCVTLSAAEQLSKHQGATLERLLSDPSATVRIEAANALARHGHTKPALPVLAAALKSDNLAAVLHAARSIEMLGKDAAGLADAMRATDKRLKGLRPKDVPATVVLPGDLDMAMFIGFSIQSFLKKIGEDEVNETARQAASGGDENWIDLFDGKSLDGWKAQKTNNVEVKVVDGAIHLMSKGTNLWFSHEKVLGDFELEADALMPDGQYNSGLAFRCQTEGRFTGYQCEIAGAKSGSIFAIGKGWVWPKGEEENAKFREMAGDSFKDGKWNRFRVRCEGDRIQVWVNGVQTADVRDEMFRKGVIAIQHHGKGDVHKFRRIRVRALGEK